MSGQRRFNPYTAIAGERLQYDPGRLLVGFETSTVAAGRDEKLIRALEAADRHDLADDLLHTIERDEPAPSWSNSAYRDLRRWFTNEAVCIAYAAQRETGHLGAIASIIPAGLTVPLGGLSSISPRSVVELTWKALDDVELDGRPVIGGVDVSFNEVAGANQPAGYYQVHVSFAILGFDPTKQSRERLHVSLKQAFELEPTASTPVQVQELRDPVRQLSYLIKRLFVRRVSIIDSRGRRNTLQRPLKAAQNAEIAAWLSGFPQTDRLILKGLRRQGDEIVATNPCKSIITGE